MIVHVTPVDNTSSVLVAAKTHASSDRMTQAAEKDYRAGNCWGELVALLLPLLQGKEKLLPRQELHVVRWLSDCHRFLDDEKAAWAAWARVNKSAVRRALKEHAEALKGLRMVHTGLKASPEARKAIEEALAIREELGLQ
jgi:hypothetical protein